MAKTTTSQALAGDQWTQIANLGQTFTLSVLTGEVLLSYASSQPQPSDPGQLLSARDAVVDISPTEKAWAKAAGAGNLKTTTATVILHKE